MPVDFAGISCIKVGEFFSYRISSSKMLDIEQRQPFYKQERRSVTAIHQRRREQS